MGLCARTGAIMRRLRDPPCWQTTREPADRRCPRNLTKHTAAAGMLAHEHWPCPHCTCQCLAVLKDTSRHALLHSDTRSAPLSFECRRGALAWALGQVGSGDREGNKAVFAHSRRRRAVLAPVPIHDNGHGVGHLCLCRNKPAPC